MRQIEEDWTALPPAKLGIHLVEQMGIGFDEAGAQFWIKEYWILQWILLHVVVPILDVQETELGHFLESILIPQWEPPQDTTPLDSTHENVIINVPLLGSSSRLLRSSSSRLLLLLLRGRIGRSV